MAYDAGHGLVGCSVRRNAYRCSVHALLQSWQALVRAAADDYAGERRHESSDPEQSAQQLPGLTTVLGGQVGSLGRVDASPELGT
jgi:hypothetical protein